MSLTDDERNAIVEYRIEKAFSALDDVRQAAAGGRWSMAANRLYYAIYHAASALLINDGYEARTHNGVITLISKHYVMSGILPKEDGRLMKKIFELRQEADYDDFIDATEADINDYLPLAETFINRFVSLIHHDN